MNMLCTVKFRLKSRNGLVSAGKKIHEILLNVEVRGITAKYVQECQLMSDLHHPNITLFLGLCFLPNCQLPVLVMERLDGNLGDLLENPSNPETLHAGGCSQRSALSTQTQTSNHPGTEI